MRRISWLVVVLLSGLLQPAARASLPLLVQGRGSLDRTNRQLHGQVLDYTRNHGADRRLWSPALGQKRDLYVYLPPAFDPGQRYPVMLWLHGFAQDEFAFLNYVVKPLDTAIAAGRLPPVIVAAPDGSLGGTECVLTAGSFFLNSRAGAFEDYVMKDVWGFLQANFPIRPEPEAHVLAGVSMGGGAALNLAIKYRPCFRVVVGLFPPVNVRWLNCRGRYMANFDPCCQGIRTRTGLGLDVVGRFYGVLTVRFANVIKPLYGLGPEALAAIARENPYEMIDAYGLQDGELDLYLGYGGRDEFNIDAQVESFLWRARDRGLTVTVGYEPNGRHNLATALKLFPGIVDWLRPRLMPFAPPSHP